MKADKIKTEAVDESFPLRFKKTAQSKIKIQDHWKKIADEILDLSKKNNSETGQ